MMKKLLITTSSLASITTLISVLLLINPDKKQISALTVGIDLPSIHTPAPYEMAASKIKETLLDELKTHTSNELFYIEHSSHSPQLLACLLMATKKHDIARQLLKQRSTLTPQQLQALREHTATTTAMKTLELLEGRRIGIVREEISRVIAELDVTPINKHAYKRSGYATYYADKHEDFSLEQQGSWHEKQKNIFKVLQEYKPQTVLDIGGNSGWFSRLAAVCGAHVIATDIDECSIEYQYQTAKHMKLPVTPLIHDVVQLKHAHEAERFASDMVFCLALIHHLVFLAGMTLEDIVEILASVTKKVLVLEFVDLEDECIQRAVKEPSFFKNSQIHSSAIDFLETYGYKNYNINTFLEISKTHFSSMKVLESSPSKTRHLLVLSKK